MAFLIHVAPQCNQKFSSSLSDIVTLLRTFKLWHILPNCYWIIRRKYLISSQDANSDGACKGVTLTLLTTSLSTKLCIIFAIITPIRSSWYEISPFYCLIVESSVNLEAALMFVMHHRCPASMNKYARFWVKINAYLYLKGPGKSYQRIVLLKNHFPPGIPYEILSAFQELLLGLLHWDPTGIHRDVFFLFFFVHRWMHSSEDCSF